MTSPRRPSVRWPPGTNLPGQSAFSGQSGTFLAMLRAMKAALGRRFQAILLLSLFVGAGMGAPALDTLLYHTGYQAPAGGETHFDPPGGCGAHAEHCVLTTCCASGAKFAAVVLGSLRIEAVTQTRPSSRPVARPNSASQTFLHHSRAPPASAS